MFSNILYAEQEVRMCSTVNGDETSMLAVDLTRRGH